MPNKDDINYQMYLDYLKDKDGESSAKAQRKKSEKIYDEKPVAPPEGMSKIKQIERKYNLEPDGEEKNVHLMTDKEFMEKYGPKNKKKKSRRAKTADRKKEYEAREESYEEEEITPVPVSDGFIAPKKNARGNDFSEDAGNEYEDISSDSSYEDVYSDSEQDEENKEEVKKKKKKKWPKVLLIIFIILAALGIVAFIFRSQIYAYIMGEVLKNTKTGQNDTGVVKQLEEIDDKNHGDKFYESSAAETATPEAWIGDWAKQSGELMYNKQIINVLLIGEDERNGDDHGRSDAMIIVSIDTINKQIKMTSVWRDTYGLIQVPKTAKSEAYETYEKINGGCNYAGPETTVKTIQNLYKVRIDGYIDTTFDSFASLIDAMDGIEVSVTEEENNYLLGYTHGGEGYAPYSWPTGHSGDKCHLSGKEALVYARIRKLDSDVKRAERQRKVMNAMIKKMTSLSQTQMLSAVAEYLSAGYVETNFSKNDISNLGKKAYQDGWKDFKMVSNSAPVSVDVDPKNGDFYLGGTYLYPNGGYSNEGVWIWLVDIPKTAQDVQKFIYGETYCVLNKYRHNVKEFNYMFYGAIN